MLKALYGLCRLCHNLGQSISIIIGQRQHKPYWQDPVTHELLLFDRLPTSAKLLEEYYYCYGDSSSSSSPADQRRQPLTPKSLVSPKAKVVGRLPPGAVVTGNALYTVEQVYDDDDDKETKRNGASSSSSQICPSDMEIKSSTCWTLHRTLPSRTDGMGMSILRSVAAVSGMPRCTSKAMRC